MERRMRTRGWWWLAVGLGVLGVALPAAWAGTTGKIAGRILDARKQPLEGANVAVVGARVGAITDAEGRYTIVNVPAGTYEVRVQLLSYRPVLIQAVLVSSDQTTRLDATLTEAAIAVSEIVVSAERPVIDVNRTSTLATVSRQQIQALPVQELADIVNLQAGVVDGHFRGGRSGEVQYQVDGVSVNNAFNNASSLKLDRSLLEEVQIVSGTFDAEYGQAMSGVVNAVLRRGSERFRWDAEILNGGFYFAQEPNRYANWDFRPFGTEGYQASISGPLGIPKTTFLVNGRYSEFDDYLVARRLFLPPVSYREVDGVPTLFATPGDGRRTPLGYSREWSGVAKLSNRTLAHDEFSYQAVLNLIRARRSQWAFRFEPDGAPLQRTLSVVHGLDWTHTFSGKAFATLHLRQNFRRFREMVYDDFEDARYDSAGAPIRFANDSLDVFVAGVDLTRFRQLTDTWVAKATYANQLRRDLQFKLGAELQLPVVEFGQDGYFNVNSGSGRITRRSVDGDPRFPGVLRYEPVIGAAFLQQETEFDDLRLRAGVRVEYFDARATLPSDLENPANSIGGVPQSVPVRTTRKISLSPRLGVSYPVTKDAALFFSYGHFYQMPQLGQAFANADYRVLADLPAGEAAGNRFGVMGNPDILPERTVQYQFGYRQALDPATGLEVNTFYKNIQELLGTEFITTYNLASYPRLTNADFGNVLGVTVSLDRKPRGLLGWAVDYTWQLARGNTSDPYETANRAAAGEESRPIETPFNWDQRHTFNATLTASRPDRFTASLILRAGSGQPYTPVTAIGGFGQSGDNNSGRKPNAITFDLRGEKLFRAGPVFGSAFIRAFNLFDGRFFNGGVFSDTGSPYYSPLATPAALENPLRLAAPRRIELGLSLRQGS